MTACDKAHDRDLIQDPVGVAELKARVGESPPDTAHTDVSRQRRHWKVTVPTICRIAVSEVSSTRAYRS